MIWCNFAPTSYGNIYGTMTFLLIIFAALVSNLIVIVQWIGATSVAGILNLIFVNFVSFLSMISFLLMVFTDPGSVPKDAQPLIDSDALNPRFHCGKCNAFKPLRAHHCRICNRCIVKMDHHCPC